ncbi:MAG: plastocyanin/azurin family copper-binding protein [Acidimicrobiia bacterium]
MTWKPRVGECGHAKPRKGRYQLYGTPRSPDGTRALAGPRRHSDWAEAMKRTVVVAGAFALIPASCGGPRAEVHDLTERPTVPDSAQIQEEDLTPKLGQAEHGAVVEIVMTDFAFATETSIFEVGETVTFLFSNKGVIAHDAVIGTEDVRQLHAAEMAEGNEGAQPDEEDAGIDLRPGGTGTLVYTFTEPGELQIACTLPNHLEAGMLTDIGVTT